MVGQVLGQYRILEPIGGGAMGSVYRAEDLAGNRRVAVKVLSDKYLHDAEARARFAREGRACLALRHPNICAVFDMGEWRGRPFLAMELLVGTTMADRMKTGRMRPEGVATIGVPVLDALETAHGQGILHRDIKPANLFLTRNGQVKVLDFGLARVHPRAGAAAGGTAGDSTATVMTFVTMPGTLLGTLGYMAPEQVRGEALDGRADLYSLGVLMVEALTGSLPIRGGGQAAVPGPLGPYLARLIEPDRSARFASAAEARDALIALNLK